MPTPKVKKSRVQQVGVGWQQSPESWVSPELFLSLLKKPLPSIPGFLSRLNSRADA